MKTYTSKELNAIIGYIDQSGQNSAKKEVLRRCCNAGLIIEALETKRGCPNQYIIIEDNFHIEGEEWIPCYCNKMWEVSNKGRVRTTGTKKLMGSLGEDGYLHICTIDETTGRTTNKMVNRLIYFSFNSELIPYAANIQIDHKNGNRQDNTLENLQPLTSIENTELRDKNQTAIKTVTTSLVNKYGYEKTKKLLENLLTNDDLCGIILSQ